MRNPRGLPPLARAALLACALSCAFTLAEESPDLRGDLDDHVAAGWIYDDIDAGYAKARESGKPLLVAFR